MLPIYLRMGQSTVMRFPEKPKKVILGNSNYYSVEFIDNDVALQPQGAVTTNLFVYGQKNVYGFILKTNQGASYDDLVQVDLKENLHSTKVEKPKSALKEISRPKIILEVGKILRVTLSRVQRLQVGSGGGPYVMDCLIENISASEVDLKNVELKIWRGKNKLLPQETIYRDDKLKAHEMTASRMIVSIERRDDVSLLAKVKNKTVKKIISRLFL